MFKVAILLSLLSLTIASPAAEFDSEAALAFIENLDIGELPEVPAAVADELRNDTMVAAKRHGGADATTASKGKAFVVAGGTTVFTPSVSSANQADVKNSFLLAQLAANHAHDRYKDFTNWYKFFVNVLNNIGWVISDFRFTGYTKAGTTIEIDKGLIDLLLALTAPEIGASEALVATLGALKNLNPNSSTFKLWESNTSHANSGNFQTCVCWQKGGNVGIAFNGMYFNANTHRGNFLWFHWSSSDMHLFQTTDSLLLNEDVYNKVRGAVVNKLGKNAVTFVANLVI